MFVSGKKYEDLKNENERTESALKNIREEIAALREEEENAFLEAKKLRRSIDAHKKAADTLRADNEALRLQLDEKEQIIRALREESGSVQALRQQTFAMLKDCKKAADEAKQKTEALKEQLRHVRQADETLRKLFSTAKSEGLFAQNAEIKAQSAPGEQSTAAGKQSAGAGEKEKAEPAQIEASGIAALLAFCAERSLSYPELLAFAEHTAEMAERRRKEYFEEMARHLDRLKAQMPETKTLLQCREILQLLSASGAEKGVREMELHFEKEDALKTEILNLSRMLTEEAEKLKAAGDTAAAQRLLLRAALPTELQTVGVKPKRRRKTEH